MIFESSRSQFHIWLDKIDQDYHHISDGFHRIQITVASLKRYLIPTTQSRKRTQSDQINPLKLLENISNKNLLQGQIVHPLFYITFLCQKFFPLKHFMEKSKRRHTMKEATIVYVAGKCVYYNDITLLNDI